MKRITLDSDPKDLSFDSSGNSYLLSGGHGAIAGIRFDDTWLWPVGVRPKFAHNSFRGRNEFARSIVHNEKLVAVGQVGVDYCNGYS